MATDELETTIITLAIFHNRLLPRVLLYNLIRMIFKNYSFGKTALQAAALDVESQVPQLYFFQQFDQNNVDSGTCVLISAQF